MRLPVLYLDLDDTVISWVGGSPRAAPGANDLFAWALSNLEVRWLTTWCPTGIMSESLLRDLSSMVRVPVETLRGIRGFDWEATSSKLNGVAWLEHLVLGRPFIWLEDEYGFTPRERAVLDRHHLAGSYLHCNVTQDQHSLGRALHHLRRWAHELGVAAA